MNKADLLQRAIRGQRAIPSRSEDQELDMHENLYVEGPQEEVVAALSGRANQVFFGRRGTGKTMILRKLLRGARPINPDSSYVAVMVQSQDFLRSLDVPERDPTSVRARMLFREFLNQVAERMLGVGDQVLCDRGLLARLGIINRARRELLAEKVLRLHSVLQHGVPVPMPQRSAQVQEVRTGESIRRETEQEAGFGLGVQATGPGKSGRPIMNAQANLAVRGKHGQTTAESVSSYSHISSAFDMGIPEIRAHFQDVAQMLQLDHIMILLDEWQALQECQAEFAQHLKTCFFGLNWVSVKIAAYRHTCRFNNGGARDNFRGMEIGQDISVAGVTDLPPEARDAIPFFYKVLYRRLLVKEPGLGNFYGPISTFDYNHLVNDLFSNSHAGKMMVRGSHGVSRDFIVAFNRVAGYVNNDLARQKATLQDIDRAYGELGRDIQENAHSADDFGGILFEYIKPTVHETGAPFFFIARNDNRWDEPLWELVAKRVIHPLADDDLPAGADVDWRGYELSYGIFHEWHRAATFSNKANADRLRWKDIKDLREGDFQKFILKIKQNPGITKKCVSCGKQYSTAAHSYVVRRLCPHCYRDQPN